jgi:cysteine-rich repeat protein
MTCTHLCGDMHITVLESCEDGNIISWDGCSSSCHKEGGFTFVTIEDANNGQEITTATPICGDGLNVKGETCDDGAKDGKGCKDDCFGVIKGYTCIGGD